jgi:hypothetical protein
MLPYNFGEKREQSHGLVEWVRQWFLRRGDVLDVYDVQDDPQYYYKGDLMVVRKDGSVQFIEVKCESSYTRKATENLAIERYSDLDKRKPGGPWSSDAHFYVHVYADGLLVVMNRARLVDWLERVLSLDREAFAFRQIPNQGWVTGTYLVPRQLARQALGAWYREYETI